MTKDDLVDEEFVSLVRAEVGDVEADEIINCLKTARFPSIPAEIQEEKVDSVPDGRAKELVREDDGGDIRQKLARLSKPEKLKAAMFGNSVVRRLLIFDPGRLVQAGVLSNPRLTLPELEEFAKNSSIDSQVLRAIAKNSMWMKSYKLKLSIVTNPKCPQDVSLKWLKFLHANDIKTISRSKNVPQSLQTAARKLASADK